jgi:hypothetical protein
MIPRREFAPGPSGVTPARIGLEEHLPISADIAAGLNSVAGMVAARFVVFSPLVAVLA